MTRPAWMPDFVPDDADLMISATNDEIHLQWPHGDGLRIYELEGAVLDTFRKEHPDFRRRLDDAMM